jgi:beta-lactamase superfamily II metal-dependent hydrolase
MPYQLDFLSVGDKSRSGDAIAIRFGDLEQKKQTVVVVDGGFQESGTALVEHIKTHYGTDSVELVVSTHPDADHSSGLSVVLTDLKVGELMMHQPWNHTYNIANMFKDGRVTDMSIAEGIRKSLENVRDLETLAAKKKIAITQPFTGLSRTDGTSTFTVLSPTLEFYRSLLPQFRCTPAPKEQAPGLLAQIAKAAKEAVVKLAEETFDIETLREPQGTHAENESSVISLLEIGDKKILLTADAGPRALVAAIAWLGANGRQTSSLTLVQVPHHGSRRNVGPTVLNSLLGPKLKEDSRLRTAVVSASPEGAPKHPSRQVTNAFRRRGAPVWGATGGTVLFNDGAPRQGWSGLPSIALHSEVEDYDD